MGMVTNLVVMGMVTKLLVLELVTTLFVMGIVTKLVVMGIVSLSPSVSEMGVEVCYWWVGGGEGWGEVGVRVGVGGSSFLRTYLWWS